MANISRRNFFKGMAVLGGSMVLGGSLTGCKDREIDVGKKCGLFYLSQMGENIYILKYDQGYIDINGDCNFSIYDTEYDNLLGQNARNYSKDSSMLLKKDQVQEYLEKIEPLLNDSNEYMEHDKAIIFDEGEYHLLGYTGKDIMQKTGEEPITVFSSDNKKHGPFSNANYMLLRNDDEVYIDPMLSEKYDLPIHGEVAHFAESQSRTK